MNDELKPIRCGCGGEPYLLGNYSVLCSKCFIKTDRENSEAEAIKVWNTAMGTDTRKIAEVMAHDIVVSEQLTNKVKMSPIHIDGSIYECPNCRTKVGYVEYTGYPATTPDTFYDWRVVKHKFCPECGIKLEW